MTDSLFTKIIKGELPCYKLYEDDKTIAFLNIYPAHPGQTLVVTKIQVDQYIDLPGEDYEALWNTVKKVATHLRTVMETERVGVVIKGVDVPHAHVHLIPFNGNQSFKTDQPNSGEPDHEALKAVAEKIGTV